MHLQLKARTALIKFLICKIEFQNIFLAPLFLRNFKTHIDDNKFSKCTGQTKYLIDTITFCF